jgi:hypothetical protein
MECGTLVSKENKKRVILLLTMFEDSIKVMALARAHLSPFNKFRKIFLDFSDKSFSVNSAEKLDDCRTFFKVGETLLR